MPIANTGRNSLSLLDLAPVPVGKHPGAALRAIIVLDREAERLGYIRFWVAQRRGALTSAD